MKVILGYTCVSWPLAYVDHLIMLTTCLCWPLAYVDHLLMLTTCLCWPLFQERSVVNLDRFHCILGISVSGLSTNANSQSEREDLKVFCAVRISILIHLFFSVVRFFKRLMYERAEQRHRQIQFSRGQHFVRPSRRRNLGEKWSQNWFPSSSVTPMLTDKTTHTHKKEKVYILTYWILNYRQFPIYNKVISLLFSDKILSAICMGFIQPGSTKIS